MLPHAQENGKSTKTKDDRISVRWKYCTRFRVENPTQRAILTVIGENCDGDQLDSYISKLTVAKRIGASRTSVYRAVKRLEALGALVAEDAGSTTHWMLPELAEIRAFVRVFGRKIRPRDRQSNSRGNSGRLSRKTCRHQFNLKHHWFNLNSHWFNLKQWCFNLVHNQGSYQVKHQVFYQGTGKLAIPPAFPTFPKTLFRFTKPLKTRRQSQRPGRCLTQRSSLLSL